MLRRAIPALFWFALAMAWTLATSTFFAYFQLSH